MCTDINHNPIVSHVCQTQPPAVSYSVDVGWLPAYYPIPNNAIGFVLQFSMGTLGCGRLLYPNIDIPRVTNITFTCDPTAGPGTIKGPARNGVENPSCHYNLFWTSAYACPVCTANDYDFFYTPCLNGQRQKTYYWKTPQICHNGIKL